MEIMSNYKKPLFTLTKKDFVVAWYSGTGAGGQHRNKHMNCCRITHPASGATGSCQTERSAEQNKKIAFRRLSESKTFLAWVKIQASMVEEGFASLDRKVDDMMREENIKTEVGVDCKRGEDYCDK